MSDDARVSIHYRRLPNRLRVYDQRVVADRDHVVVTLSEPLELDEPMTFNDEIMLERGSLAVWFTFPDSWHDIGRFHAADGTFTGLYANVITPPVMGESIWHTTDLFLDVWWPRHGEPHLLDEDELARALERGQIEQSLASRARLEAERLLELAEAGAWPPPIVERWTLERSLARVGDPA